MSADLIARLAPCPFCGAHLKHKTSWAKSFQPNRLYHEYHHPDVADCPMSRGPWCFADDEHNDGAREVFIARWNRRPATALEAPAGMRKMAAKRWRHKKRGSTYTEVGRAELQVTGAALEGDEMVVYRCEADGKLWVRPAWQFDDGRFEPLHAAPDPRSSEIPNNWQPIASAPKGQKLIAGYRNALGKWRSIMATYYLPGTLDATEFGDGGDEDGFAPEGWYENSETHDEILPCETPTHWQPLPSPPLPEGE